MGAIDGAEGEVHYGEHKADNGDHKAISITLTSALKPRIPERNQPVSELLSFISAPKFAASPSLSTRWLRLGGITVVSVTRWLEAPPSTPVVPSPFVSMDPF